MKKLTTLLLIFLGSVLYAQEYTEFEEFQLKALEGLDKIGLYAWEQDSVIVNYGFTEDSLNTILNNIFTEYYIPVTDFVTATKLPGSPSIEVKINAQMDDKYNIALFTSMKLIQDVLMDRDRQIRHYSGITWERDTLGFTDTSRLSVDLENQFRMLAEEFVTDYAYVNQAIIDSLKAEADSTFVEESLTPEPEEE